MRDLPNTRLIPTEYAGYHNLIAAADVVIGKAGGSTVAECIGHRTPFIYTVREGYIENDLLCSALDRYAHARYIPRADFEAGDWVERLDDFIREPYEWPDIRIDGAQVAAGKLMERINENGADLPTR